MLQNISNLNAVFGNFLVIKKCWMYFQWKKSISFLKNIKQLFLTLNKHCKSAHNKLHFKFPQIENICFKGILRLKMNISSLIPYPHVVPNP